jgi:hypothetical protein
MRALVARIFRAELVRAGFDIPVGVNRTAEGLIVVVPFFSDRWEEALPILEAARRLAEKEGAAVRSFVCVPPDEDLSGDSLTPVITPID